MKDHLEKVQRKENERLDFAYIEKEFLSSRNKNQNEKQHNNRKR